jgi:TolA-binding protein
VSSPEGADLLLAAARVALARGQADVALPLVQNVDRFWSEFDPASRWAGEAAFWLARCYTGLGREADARPVFARAAKNLARSPLAVDAKLVRLATEPARNGTIATR